jgi:hypothetical protein
MGAIWTRFAEMNLAVVWLAMRSERDTATSHALKKSALPAVGCGHGEVEQCRSTKKGEGETASGS